MTRHQRIRMLPIALAAQCFLRAAQAADEGSFIVLRADTGITIGRLDGKSGPAAANRILNSGDSLCFDKAKGKIALRQTESGHVIEYETPESGCRTVKDVVSKAAALAGGSPLKTFKQVWAALSGHEPGRGSVIVAATRSESRKSRGGSPFCEVPAYTDWYVLDSLEGLTIPVDAGAKGALIQLSQQGRPHGAPTPLTAQNGVLRVPRAGAPGQIFRLSLAASDGVTCELRLGVVATRDYPEIAAAKTNASSQHDAGVIRAIHALSTIYRYGRAWTLEALRQLSTHQDAAEEVRLATQYLGMPNSACANIATDHPVRFDSPLLRAERSYLSEGDRALFLVWRGGKPPYRVALENRADGSLVTEKTGVWHCEVSLPSVPLAAGGYRIRIMDANGEAYVEDNLEVVPVGRRPVPPNDSGSASRTWLDEAQWLADTQNGAWRLEAVQHVAARLAETAKAQAWISRNAARDPQGR